MSYYYPDLQHVYIHWPFCPYKCHFCDFVAMASHEQFMHQYHQALIQEIENFQMQSHEKPRLRSLYFGGGTPSTYPGHLLLDTFATLRKQFYFDELTEITIEVNPGTVTVELLDIWKQVGINRLSIGVQSLKDAMLKSLNRHQTRDDVAVILKQASERFDNVSVDFIIGMPGVLDEEWKEMMQQAVHWPIKHMSIYFLTVHEDTPLYFKVNSKKIQLPADDAMVDLYHWTVSFLQEYGFNRYEISNFAQKGHESVHNAAYWNRKPYRGFGLGACSFTGTTRFANTKNLGKYLESLHGQNSLIEMSELLTDKQIMLERLMLGLRQSKGMAVVDYLSSLSDIGRQHFYKNLDVLQQAHLVDYQKGIVRLTPQGYALENEVTLRLFSEN